MEERKQINQIKQEATQWKAFLKREVLKSFLKAVTVCEPSEHQEGS